MEKKQIFFYRRVSNEETIQRTLPLWGLDILPSHSSRLFFWSFNLPGILLGCHCVYRERPCVSGIVHAYARTYACTLDNDEGLPRRAGQPSWLTSSRAPSTQPRNADFLVAIAPYFLLLLSPILSLVYPSPGIPFLPLSPTSTPSAGPISLFPSFSPLSSPRTHRARRTCADVRVSVAKRSETPHPRYM